MPNKSEVKIKNISVTVPAGMAANGQWILGGGIKDTTNTGSMEEPFIKFARQLMRDAGDGVCRGLEFSEALRIADALPGGMSRTNLMLALRNLKIYQPCTLDGIYTELRGNADAYYIEGSEYSKFDADAQTWMLVDIVLDANGGTPNCA